MTHPGRLPLKALSSKRRFQAALRPMKYGASLALAAGLLTSAPAALAQDTNFVVEQFEPLPAQGSNLLNIGKSDVVKHLHPSFGFVLHYQDDPLQLVLRNDQDNIRQRVIDHVLKGEVWASFGLFDHFDVGLVMPVVLAQKAGEVQTGIGSGRDFDSFTTGDLRIVPKIKLLNAADFGGFGLAIAAPISVPTGDEESYNSEGNVRVEPRLILDYRTSGGFTIAANVAFQPKANRKLLNFENDDTLKWGVGLEVPLVRDRLALIGTAFGAVGVGADVSADEGRTMPIEALGGLQWWITDDIVTNIAAGGGLTDGVGSPDVRGVFSFGYTPINRGLDSDGDGYEDSKDKCPFEPEDFDGFEDADGCPDPDNDKDGILDVDDKCPNDPEDFDGFEDADGCPDPDNDKDGIPDSQDGPIDSTGFGACRDQAEDFDGFQDGDGCPDPDNDNDGILDINDGPVDSSGFGSCRDKPETFNRYQDDDGCPDEKPTVTIDLEQNRIEILEKVFFDFNKATIQSVSFPLLDEVVRILKENPQVNLVRIEGHTDHVGSRAYNVGLSTRRANAINKYLTSKGVEKKRLISRGYGFDYPIDTNETQEGRDRNRRVEFNILEIDGKPVTNQVIRKGK